MSPEDDPLEIQRKKFRKGNFSRFQLESIIAFHGNNTTHPERIAAGEKLEALNVVEKRETKRWNRRNFTVAILSLISGIILGHLPCIFRHATSDKQSPASSLQMRTPAVASPLVAATSSSPKPSLPQTAKTSPIPLSSPLGKSETSP